MLRKFGQELFGSQLHHNCMLQIILLLPVQVVVVLVVQMAAAVVVQAVCYLA
jgi:hypothetical protein